MIKLALVDDHTLFRKGLISLIQMAHNDCAIIFEADNGIDMQKKILPDDLPDIILMDVNMPGMNGYESVRWVHEKYPCVKILVVSMVQHEESILLMLRLGVKGYLGKDVEPKELGEALDAVQNKGFYYTDYVTGKLVHSLQSAIEDNPYKKEQILRNLTEREKDFLQFACSELTYNEIAKRMFVSPKTIDGYRSALFDKFSVTSRVGLVLHAVKYGLVVL